MQRFKPENDLLAISGVLGDAGFSGLAFLTLNGW